MAYNPIPMGHSNNLPCIWPFFKLVSKNITPHQSVSTRYEESSLPWSTHIQVQAETGPSPTPWPTDQSG